MSRGKLVSAVKQWLRQLGILIKKYWKYLLEKNPFALVFVGNLIFCELLLINFYLIRCSFPLKGTDLNNAIVIADPQLTDHYSYKQTGLILKMTEFYSDIYMKRNYKRILRMFKPDLIIFAGDLFDGGREWADEEFTEELARFQNIFQTSILTLGVAGNHDIGFGKTIVHYAYSRYTSTFGKLNYVSFAADHAIIALDTIGLSGRPESVAYKTAFEFLQSLKDLETDPSRRLLLTHVPFFRPNESGCGSRRNFPPMINAAGYQYQNMIQRNIVQQIVDIVKPSLVISGDDHDDCIFNHTMYGHPFLEHTLPTFSWLQGNIYPAFGMLSLRERYSAGYLSAETMKLDVCALPPQLPIYLYWYTTSGILCIIGVILFSRYSFKQRFSYQLVYNDFNGIWKYTRNRFIEFSAIVASSYLTILLIEWFL